MDPSTSLASPSPDPLGLRGLDGFYRWHSRIYDWTRPFLLFGRRAAGDAVEAKTGQLVLDVGCGTGFNLGRLARTGAFVVGVECTEPMRRRAQARVDRSGFGRRVLFDGRPYGTHAGYRGAVDRLLFSYSLCMIPPFAEVLESARTDLRAGGRIVVVDFLDASPLVAYGLERSHVQLGPARLSLLRQLFEEQRLEVVSLGLWRYFLFVGKPR